MKLQNGILFAFVVILSVIVANAVPVPEPKRGSKRKSGGGSKPAAVPTTPAPWKVRAKHQAQNTGQIVLNGVAQVGTKVLSKYVDTLGPQPTNGQNGGYPYGVPQQPQYGQYPYGAPQVGDPQYPMYMPNPYEMQMPPQYMPQQYPQYPPQQYPPQQYPPQQYPSQQYPPQQYPPQQYPQQGNEVPAIGGDAPAPAPAPGPEAATA